MKRRSIRVGAFSIGAGVFMNIAIVACTSSSNTGTGSDDPSTSAGFVDAFCGYVASCCGSENLPDDGNECRAFYSLGASSYIPANGQACLDAVKSQASSDPNWCAEQNATTTAACNAAYKSSSGGGGGVQPGGSCTSNTDCVTSASGDTAECYFPPNSSKQICVDEVHGKAGDGPCFGTVTTSGSGSATLYNIEADAGAGTAPEIYCFVSEGVSCSSTSNTCVALAAIGASCTNGAQCVSGSHCDFNGGTCVANAATGAACTLDSDCVTGDGCDTTTKTCIALLAAGAACASGTQCQSGGCANGKCAQNLGAAFGLALLCGGDGGT